MGISGPWRAEVMPPLGSWEQELRTVLCCTSLEKDRVLSVPRIFVLLLPLSDPRLTQHGCVCSVARWHSIAATQSSEAFRLLWSLCCTLAQGASFTAYILTCPCVLEQHNVAWHKRTAQVFPCLFYPPYPLSSSCPPYRTSCTFPALLGLFSLSFSLCPLSPPP